VIHCALTGAWGAQITVRITNLSVAPVLLRTCGGVVSPEVEYFGGATAADSLGTRAAAIRSAQGSGG